MSRQMTPEERKACLKGIKRRLATPYYSRGILVSEAKTGGNVLTFTSDTLVLFNYGIAEPMSAAIGGGGEATITGAELTARGSDTNLTKGGSTVDSSDFVICGVGLHINPESDGEAIRALYSQLCIELCFGRNTEVFIGPPTNAPGGGGLMGTHRNDVVAAASTSAFASNGFPDFANVFKTRKLRWQRAGKAASDFNVKVTLERDRAIQGVAASPANIRFDFLVKLYGYEVAPLSPNG